MTNTTCPWKLYLFAFTNLAMALVIYGIFGDPCKLWTGREATCNSTERVMSYMMSVCCLYVFFIFYALTYSCKADAPKLKRLAMFATNCTVVSFAGIIMTGSTKLGGTERSIFHILDMLYFFFLFIVLVSAMSDGSEVAGSRTPFTRLGINPKTMVLLVTIIAVIKMFAISDFMPVSYYLKEGTDLSQLAQTMLGWCVIMMFQIVFGLVFALAYGDDKDWENMVYVFIVMIILTGLGLIHVHDQFQSGLMKQSWITLLIYLILCVIAIIGGRKQQQRDLGYVPIST